MAGTSSPDGVYLNTSTGHNELRIGGSINASKRIRQTVLVNAKKGDTIIIGGQAWGNSSIGADDKRKFGVIAQVYSTNTDSNPKIIELNFNLTSANASLTVAKHLTLEKDCYKVVYSFVYDDILGDAVFENSFIYVGNFGEHYVYDNEGQLEEVKNDDGDQLTNYNYNNDNELVSVVQTISGDEITVAEYEYDNDHNVTKAANNIGTEIVTEYDTNGLVTSQTIAEKSDDAPNTATASTTETMIYTDDGNYLKTYIDANGGETHYAYDDDLTTDHPLIGLVTKVTDPEGNVTLYTYDPDTDELLSTSDNAGSSATSFTTQNNLPKTVTRNDTTYLYEYDSQNRVTAAKVGNQALSSKTYDSRQRLQAQTYANGAVFKPEYDDRDRLIGEKWGVNGVVPSGGSPLSIEYFYNDNDRLSKVDDYESGVSYHYDYAFSGLLHRITGNDGSKTEYDYDMSGTMSHLTFSKNNETIYKARYATDEKGNQADVILGDPLDDINDDVALHYNYDGLGRLTGRSVGPLLDTRTYRDVPTTNKTGNLVSEYANENGDGVALQRYGYEYDLNGNITKITDAVTGKTTEYTYDGLNRLESEGINGDTFQYTYDAGGNLTTNSTSLHSYTYSTGDWKDQLISFDGRAITYDDQGNPSTYQVSPSSADVYEYKWQRGTQLAGITGNNRAISYAYDASGRRTSKQVDGITTDYLYSGDLLMRQQTGSDILDFSYDANGTAIGFKHNGTLYYYLRNLQNDVVAITDAEGNVVAEYSYDAWGNAVVSGTLDAAELETKWLPRFIGASGLFKDEADELKPEITALGIADKNNLQTYIESCFTAQGSSPGVNISNWIDGTLTNQKDFLRSSEFCTFLVNGNIEEIKAAFDPQDTASIPFCAYFAEIADSLRDCVVDILGSAIEDEYDLYAINSMLRDILRFYLFLLTDGTTNLESDIAALLTVTKKPADIRNAPSARPALYAMLGLGLPEEEMNALTQGVLELNIFDPESLRAFCEEMNVNSQDVEGWLQNVQISLMNPASVDHLWSFVLASALTDPAELEDDPPALYFSNMLNGLKEIIDETLTTVPELDLGGLRVSEMDADTAFSAAILLGELTVMNPDAESIMLLAEILGPKTGSVTELAVQYAAVAALNPIRYRGYYYDAETGYYFLNTRYYNPEWRRFLNADALFVAGDPLNASNMYAYCNGNPVMYNDPSGMDAKSFSEDMIRIGSKATSWILLPATVVFFGSTDRLLNLIMLEIVIDSIGKFAANGTPYGGDFATSRFAEEMFMPCQQIKQKDLQPL